jgi:hypothetical protein
MCSTAPPEPDGWESPIRGKLQAEGSGRAQVDVSRSELSSPPSPNAKRKRAQVGGTFIREVGPVRRSCCSPWALANADSARGLTMPGTGPVPLPTDFTRRCSGAVPFLARSFTRPGLDLAETLCNRSAGAWMTGRLRVLKMSVGQKRQQRDDSAGDQHLPRT